MFTLRAAVIPAPLRAHPRAPLPKAKRSAVPPAGAAAVSCALCPPAKARSENARLWIKGRRISRASGYKYTSKIRALRRRRARAPAVSHAAAVKLKLAGP